MRILDVAGLRKYFGGLAATSDVAFHVDQGEIVGLIGPNGAGKTTLFNLISGAIKPDAGTIRFKETNIAGMKPYRICRAGIARTFQSVQLFSNMSVFHNVLVGSLFGATKQKAARFDMVGPSDLLELVGLAGMGDLRAMDLRLANQKRLEIARALATRPDLLLLDKVMAGLNPTEVAEAMHLVRRISGRGITIVMIEHVMKAIMSICSRVIVLHYGQKLAEGKPEEIARDKTVIEVYLGE